MQPASSVALEAQWPDLVAAVSAAIDLEGRARTSGALVRRREIRSGEALLRLALAYGPGGLSLRAAAAWAEFIVRTGWKQLRLLDTDGAPVAWEPIFDALAAGEVAERMVLVDYSGKGRRS